MQYFSELSGKKVFTQDRKYIGKVTDLLFLPSETPLVTKFVVKTTKGSTINISDQEVRKNGIGFIVNNNYKQENKAENEVSLLNKLQNHQIVDISGAKVIRVNDVVISDVPDYTISGIDIGVLGVFRWIGAAKFVSKLLRGLNIHFNSDFIPWSQIEAGEIANGRIVLKSEKERLKKIHPADLVEHLEHATIRNVLKSLRVMDEKLSARVVADLNVDYQREIFQRFNPSQAGKILSLIPSDDAVDVLLSLDTQKREKILEHIQRGKKGPILYLLAHARTPIGHLMNTEYITVPSDVSAKVALAKVKKEAQDFSELLYVYAVNKKNQIVGVCNLHELIIQKLDESIYKFMNQNLVLGRLTTPKEILLRRMIKYKLYAIPIVDDKRELLGIVSLQDIVEEELEDH